MARLKPVPGICDRCGQRYRLSDLRFEYILGANTNIRTCPACYDPSHPQLDTRNVQTSDKQSVPQSRSEVPELAAERSVFGWNPVGLPLTGTAITAIGLCTVADNDPQIPSPPEGYRYVVKHGAFPIEFVTAGGKFVIGKKR